MKVTSYQNATLQSTTLVYCPLVTFITKVSVPFKSHCSNINSSPKWMSQVLHISYNRFPRLMLNTLSDTKINWIALHSIPLSCQALKLSRRCNLKQVDRIGFMLLLIKKSIRHQPLHILQLSTAFKLFDSFKPAILHLTALSSQILTCSRRRHHYHIMF
ncbi:hypothetical protein SUGI_0445330 [Cryptomeria japonica]|nr:hypothetical protein SUGI_0445330 [Cryptomeria japonica]